VAHAAVVTENDGMVLAMLMMFSVEKISVEKIAVLSGDGSKECA
jgi:hypothetical protein